MLRRFGPQRDGDFICTNYGPFGWYIVGEEAHIEARVERCDDVAFTRVEKARDVAEHRLALNHRVRDMVDGHRLDADEAARVDERRPCLSALPLTVDLDDVERRDFAHRVVGRIETGSLCVKNPKHSQPFLNPRALAPATAALPTSPYSFASLNAAAIRSSALAVRLSSTAKISTTLSILLGEASKSALRISAKIALI